MFEKDKLEIRKCYKCGKVSSGEKWMVEDEIPHIYLGRAGYGSCMDGSDIDFYICDKCLYDFIETFPVESRERIHNSGSNYSMESDAWIRMENGEMKDEEYEDLGYYSPRQIESYKNKFPKCAHPTVHIFDDGSSATYCPYGASGNKDFSADCNISTECYYCTNYVDKSLPNHKELTDRSYEIEYFRKSLLKRLADTDEEFFKMLEEYNLSK